MPRIITLDEKLAVIDAWLRGESRNDIAIKHNLGSGTVYNIIEEWSNEIGAQRANRLREIAIKLKNNGLTVSDCAKGLRMLMIVKKYGVTDDEDQVTYFLKEVYTKCHEVGLTTQQVFDYISDILKFSGEISITQIPQFMKKSIDEKEKLEKEVQELLKKRQELTEIKNETEQDIQELRNNIETMSKTYQIFTLVKYQLSQYGIGMENIDQFVKCVASISKEGYNPVQILGKISDHDNLEKEANHYETEVNRRKYELTELNNKIDYHKHDLSYMEIKIGIIDELETRGFGINELRILINLLNEIGLEHNVEFKEIRKEFFEDVKNYEEVIGSRKERDRLKKELKILEEQTMKEREKYNSYPKVIQSIMRLAGSRIYEQDIVKIDKILSMTDYYLYKGKHLYKEDLMDDLQKYGNLKLAIKHLEDIEIDLKSKKKTQDGPTTKKTGKG